jgi:hypothetical protein
MKLDARRKIMHLKRAKNFTSALTASLADNLELDIFPGSIREMFWKNASEVTSTRFYCRAQGQQLHVPWVRITA